MTVFQLYAEKVSTRGLCAVAQCESLRYKLIGGLAVRRFVKIICFQLDMMHIQEIMRYANFSKFTFLTN